MLTGRNLGFTLLVDGLCILWPDRRAGKELGRGELMRLLRGIAQPEDDGLPRGQVDRAGFKLAIDEFDRLRCGLTEVARGRRSDHENRKKRK
jgi:hypothetical protein